MGVPKLFDESFMEFISRGIKKVIDIVGERLSEQEMELSKFLEESGWLTDFDLLMVVAPRVLKHYQRGDVVRAEKLYRKFCFLFYNNDRLDVILEEWKKNQFLNERIHILEQVVAAHKLGLYSLTVPVLAAQVEGYMWDVNQPDGKTTKQGDLKKLFKDETKVLFSKSVSHFVDTKLLTQFKYGEQPKSDISRHAILHGYAVDYGSKVNSIKLIMLLNILHKSQEL